MRELADDVDRSQPPGLRHHRLQPLRQPEKEIEVTGEGGLDAWKKAGLPVSFDRSKPIDIMRQVQIAAGSLVLIGVMLGFLVNPGFYALSGFVGAGLLFAGVSGFCGMARLLGVMPWNRRAHA